VRHGSIVATPETFPIRFSLLRRKMRVTVLIAVVHVWAAMIPIILARSFDPVVKAATLELVQFLRRRIPAAPFLTIGQRR
jgi:hypothetical protein